MLKELSFVIPVYNGAATIGAVVDRIEAAFPDVPHEIVLVNDGSADESEEACAALAERFPGTVVFLQLARNFGEHSAVLAGLRATCGGAVAVLDDDAQNPPEEIPKMLAHLREARLDVVYGRYVERKHGWFRRFGSWLNGRMATVLLGKPADLYLSSFKVMDRFVVNEIVRYQGPFPYIDGLIYRSSTRLGQVDVAHDERAEGTSNYTLLRLLRLWSNMFLSFSIVPLRLSMMAGVVAFLFGTVMLAAILIEKLWIDPTVPRGVATTISCVILFSGVQLVMLGAVGEYVGRILLEQNRTPQSVVRYVKRCAPEPRAAEE